MEQRKICPIMSRPTDCDAISDEDDQAIVERHGFYIDDKIPWQNVFMCQKEKCVAWLPYLNESKGGCRFC